MFSQEHEEQIIIDFFGDRVGSFLDIGAWDGVELSNTRALSLHGWRGVLVEPNPDAFVKLMENAKSVKGAVCVNAAVSDLRQVRQFHVQSEWGGTLNDERNRSCGRGNTGNFYLLTMTPDDLLEIGKRESMAFEFVSLDAEWMDDVILGQCASLLERTELLCVEVTEGRFSPSDPIPSGCSQLGFNKTVGKTRGNLIVTR
jgi:FkbM family methyltransferase